MPTLLSKQKIILICINIKLIKPKSKFSLQEKLKYEQINDNRKKERKKGKKWNPLLIKYAFQLGCIIF